MAWALAAGRFAATGSIVRRDKAIPVARTMLTVVEMCRPHMSYGDAFGGLFF
jgi:hypothetical protein